MEGVDMLRGGINVNTLWNLSFVADRFCDFSFDADNFTLALHLSYVALRYVRKRERERARNG